MEIEVTLTKKIERCYHDCPHFGIDGGPGPVMVCDHPDAPERGYIISHPECEQGFPPKCPELLKVASGI